MSSTNIVIMNRTNPVGPAKPVRVVAKDYDDFALLELTVNGTRVDLYLDDISKIMDLGVQIAGAAQVSATTSPG